MHKTIDNLPAGEFPFYEELGEKRTKYTWDTENLATPLTVDHYVHFSSVTGDSGADGPLGS